MDSWSTVRTDLALEARESIEDKADGLHGVTVEEHYDETSDVHITKVVVETKNGAKMLGKPMPMPEASSQISEFCIDLISRCTKTKPDERPSFEEILKDLREHGYGLADEIDRDLIEKRDNELTSFELTQ